jgi:hypothetical protein
MFMHPTITENIQHDLILESLKFSPFSSTHLDVQIANGKRKKATYVLPHSIGHAVGYADQWRE